MKTSDVNNQQHILEPLINQAIIHSITSLNPKSKLQEPDYVAALTTIFTQDFYRILDWLFPNYTFAVSSVFCHQKPTVDIGEPRKPELGDLLFVYIYEDSNEALLFNSLLLQAKISSSPFHTIALDEMHQLKLYREWPKFTYHRAGKLNGTIRDIYPKTITDGAQYLLIDNNPKTNGINCPQCCYPMGCAIPDKQLIINQSLAQELIDFLKFKAGRTFDENPVNTKDDWSKMIWDLLKISVANANRRNIFDKSFPRRTICTKNDIINMFFESYTADFNDNELSDDEGISTIIIRSKRRPPNYEQ